MGDERTRTYSWEDPLVLRDALAGRSGLELMQAMAAGELPPPPIAETLGFRLVEAGPGHAVFECEPAEYHYNPIGIVHPGRRVATTEARIEDAQGRLCAHGTSTILVL